MADLSVHSSMTMPVDGPAIERALATLREFKDAPTWQLPVTNCTEAEIAAGSCVTPTGETLVILGYVGRNDGLMAAEPLPMRIRPPSNYYWRSSPFAVNGENVGSAMAPSVDFRYAYWLGRWVRR